MKEFVRITLCVIFLPLGMMVSASRAGAQDRTQGRSMVITRRGVVSAENPLAAQAGASVLAHGGNAVDAAVATNAVMGVVEPMMNGIGGDLFAIVYDAKTGKIEWAHTEVCDDSWDYDTVQAPTIMQLADGSVTGTGGGQYPATKTAVGAASKSGYYSTLDAATGKLLARSPYITKYSRPHRVPTTRGTVVCPGIYGGLEYGPASFNAESQSLFLAGNNFCMRYKVNTQAEIEEHAPGEDDLEGTAEQVGPRSIKALERYRDDCITSVLAAIDETKARHGLRPED